MAAPEGGASEEHPPMTGIAPVSEPGDVDVPSSTISLLLVEDDDAFRYAISRQLQSAGYRVTSAADGMAALNTLDQATFDIVIIDCVMPPGTLRGAALARMIRIRYPRTPFFFITAHPDITAAEGGMPDAPILLKPLNLPELHATVVQMLA
jgi:CheY-like chemotaxis protein